MVVRPLHVAIGLRARGRASSFLDLLQLELEAERLAGRSTDGLELYLPRVSSSPPPAPPLDEPVETLKLKFDPLAMLSLSAAQTLHIGQLLLRAPLIPAKQIALLCAHCFAFSPLTSLLQYSLLPTASSPRPDRDSASP